MDKLRCNDFVLYNRYTMTMKVFEHLSLKIFVNIVRVSYDTFLGLHQHCNKKTIVIMLVKFWTNPKMYIEVTIYLLQARSSCKVSIQI